MLNTQVVDTRRGRAVVLLVAGLLTTIVYSVALSVARPALTGDEPHYLISAISLAHDRDVDLANQYASKQDREAAYGSPNLDPHAYRYRPADSALRSVHGVGLPLLLVPATACENVRACARISMLPFGVAAALLLLILLLRLTSLQLRYRLAAWALVALSFPATAYASQIYPEGPAAALLLAVLVLLTGSRPSRRRSALVGLIAGLLPWLHVRYLLFTLLVLGGLAVLLLRDKAASPRAFAAARRAWLSAALGAAVPVVVLLALFERWYGSFSIAAPYQALNFAQDVRPRIEFLPRYLFGQLLDYRQGWLPYAPASAIGLTGTVVFFRRYRCAALLAGGAALLYFVVVAATGVSPGYALPGRYLVVIMPLAAFPLAVALQVSSTIRAVAAVGAVAGIQILYEFLREPSYLYPGVFAFYPAGLARLKTLFPNADVTANASAPVEYSRSLLLLLLLVSGALLVDEIDRRRQRALHAGAATAGS